MYHSEATLLPDGQVLVSGSDSETQGLNEELRTEVYIPPYLNQGLTQPTVTVQNTDWTYGGQYQINVQLFQGQTETMRVSLLAAVSSTHGNVMGGRTIFSRIFRARIRSAPSPRHPTQTSHLQDGTSCLFWMARRRRIAFLFALAVILHSLVTGPISLDLPFRAYEHTCSTFSSRAHFPKYPMQSCRLSRVSSPYHDEGQRRFQRAMCKFVNEIALSDTISCEDNRRRISLNVVNKLA
jgi:hypothetical protein